MSSRQQRRGKGKSQAKPAATRNQPSGSGDKPTAQQKAADIRLAVAQAGNTDEVLSALDGEQLTPAKEFTAVPAGPGNISAAQLLAAFDALVEQRAEYMRCAESARERERAAEDQVRQLDALREETGLEHKKATAARAEADRHLREAVARSERLAEREAQVHSREREAEAGFSSRAAEAHDRLTAELAQRRDAVRADLDAGRAAVAAERERLLEELERQRSEWASSYKRQRDELERSRTELTKQEDRLTFDRGALRGLQIDLERREAEMEAEITARAAAEVATIDHELHTTRIKAEAAEKLVDDLSARLQKHESDLLKIGNVDPSRLMEQLERVRSENAELRDKLAARLDDDDLDLLRRLEQQNHELKARREQLEYQLQELRGNVLANRINNLQVKQLSDAEQHFALLTRGYETRIAELKSTIEDLYRDRPDPGTPLFPRCVGMDDDATLNDVGDLVDEVPDLSKLARALQATMFSDSARAYRLNDVCAVLGGLAMSRLHLLEGMSGIGKTSLPRALAAALGTHCAVIEVQAGWRDRTDLFGHHNTFEKRFEETEFLQALYQAQTPRFRDRPYFIVLDEMNLSRPEQYFSVMLSKLENDDGKLLQLVTKGSGRAPRHMPGGTSIALPDNVWFIGTANQDESTLEFADKTYNRSYLMELPAQRPWLPRTAHQVQPYSTQALRAAFAAAGNQHRAAAESALDLIRSLEGDLYEHGRVRMSPRVEAQLENYVPVVMAAWEGERPQEHQDYDDSEQDGLALATDHFLATKVLRQLRGRYDVNSERIAALQESVKRHWEQAGFVGGPMRCLGVLEDEQRRRDG
ncbi:AAA family ATPase [Micromonospora aurantiaca (nom. illeg.)]|uniref:AAA family ATPase n=1 Tax=Micromonospora aurantiaca (nom. illeg.) TaxID=47850 RepID=UPI003F49EDAA